MPVLRPGSARRALSALIGMLAALLAMTFALPGSAFAAQGRGDQAIPHPEDDWAGSQILKHEGGPTAGDEPSGDEPSGLLATVEGVDVSGHQGNVNWATLWSSGVRFAYVKATEGTSYINPYFAQQYNGSYNVGMIRGAYHFALPGNSTGAAQANYFVDHGGGWSKDGKTLPGALDMEYNPYGATCYGLSTSAMVNWIKDFSNTYKARTGRDPVIYTSTSWWKTCTGNSAAFGAINPLWIPRYGSSVGELPAGWGFHTIWQYTSSGPTVGDHDQFNGALDRLQALANG
ncbi:hydrolase [Streptomyces hygroscopicus subsp. sporocinereus]|uniref:Lysozyme n=1 Tax=Streptomyces hygroscopicus TaxID=1912 RepID=A0ABQ3U810_STRHY|nr:lysozyme [Streptomyces hygroscopicus]GHJ31356.1 hydrolase [Streptomyces hygroscopicus]